MMDLAAPTAELERLMDDMLAFNLRWIDKWTVLEYDGLHFADDWGEQARLMIRPATWRKLFKPRYAEMFKKVHDAGMDVWFHTDGHINDIFGDLIEIGVDVINSQVKVVGLDWVAANVRGKVAFRTDIDRQHVMPFGVAQPGEGRSPSRLRGVRHARRRPHRLRRGGSGRAAGEHPGDVRGVPGVRHLSLSAG